MSNLRIVYTRPDGGVSVVVPAPSFVAKFRTEADAIAAIRAKDVPPDATDVTERTTDDLPKDRLFRNAWRMAVNKPAVDLPAARQIHMDRIRQVRDAELAKLDVAFMRAVERGDRQEQSAIAADKQRLRDLPQTFDLTVAQTPDDLAALWPDGLPVHDAYKEMVK